MSRQHLTRYGCDAPACIATTEAHSLPPEWFDVQVPIRRPNGDPTSSSLELIFCPLHGADVRAAFDENNPPEFLYCEHWAGKGHPQTYCPHCPNGNRNPRFSKPEVGR